MPRRSLQLIGVALAVLPSLGWTDDQKLAELEALVDHVDRFAVIETEHRRVAPATPASSDVARTGAVRAIARFAATQEPGPRRTAALLALARVSPAGASEAITALRELVDDPSARPQRLTVLRWLGKHLAAAQDPAGATGAYLEIVCGDARAVDLAACKSAAPVEAAATAWIELAGILAREPSGLDRALTAYGRVPGTSAAYPTALFERGRLAFGAEHWPEAIEAFDAFVREVDRSQRGEPRRAEAITRIAEAMANILPPSVLTQPATTAEWIESFYYPERAVEGHVHDVFARMAEVLAARNDWGVAEWVCRRTLSQWPTNGSAPADHARLIDVLTRGDQIEAAEREGTLLATSYRHGSRWQQANANDPAALARQREVAEPFLARAASRAHVRRELTEAIALYRAYLTDYPGGPASMRYQLADALQHHGDLTEAATEYALVRDRADVDTELRRDAALGAVAALQAVVDAGIQQGTLIAPDLPDQAAAKDGKALELARPYADLLAALDAAAPFSGEGAGRAAAWSAALVLFRHHRFDEAIPRLERIVSDECGTSLAPRAKDALLVIYLARGDSKRVDATTEQFTSRRCGDQAAYLATVAQQRAIRYKKAAQRFQDGDFAGAAIEWYALAADAADDVATRETALYNAVIAFDRADMPRNRRNAIDAFLADPRLARSKNYVDVLWLSARGHERELDLEKAVAEYLVVAKLDRDTTRRFDALYNAAYMQDLRHLYSDRKDEPGALSLWARFAAAAVKPSDRSIGYWMVALIYEKKQDPKRMATAFAEWRDRFARLEPRREVESYYKEFVLQSRFGNKPEAMRARRAAVAAWACVPATDQPNVAGMAAECAFAEAEAYQLAELESFKLMTADATVEQLKKIRAELDARSGRVMDRYVAVATYRSVEWTMAAKVRAGDVLITQAEKILAAPIPRVIRVASNANPEILDVYQSRLEEGVQSYFTQAAGHWRDVVQAGKQAGVSNRWTDLARERLSTYVSTAEYPAQHAPIIDRSVQP